MSVKGFNDFIKESKTYKISNINYVLDGEYGSDLPEEMTIEIPSDMNEVETDMNESFIIGNYPLDKIRETKEGLDNLVNSIDDFMGVIIDEFEDNDTKEYDKELLNVVNKISDKRDDIRSLNDSILEYLHKRKNKN